MQQRSTHSEESVKPPVTTPHYESHVEHSKEPLKVTQEAVEAYEKRTGFSGIGRIMVEDGHWIIVTKEELAKSRTQDQTNRIICHASGGLHEPLCSRPYFARGRGPRAYLHLGRAVPDLPGRSRHALLCRRSRAAHEKRSGPAGFPDIRSGQPQPPPGRQSSSRSTSSGTWCPAPGSLQSRSGKKHPAISSRCPKKIRTLKLSRRTRKVRLHDQPSRYAG